MTVSIQDRSEIEELYARYCGAFDIGDVDAWVSTFTANARVGDFQGPDAIRAYIERRLRERPDDPESDKVHMIFNLLLEYGSDQDHARGFCYLLRVGRSRDTGQLQIVQPGPICQMDEYERVGGKWLFSVRNGAMELPEPGTRIPGLR